MLTAVLGGKEPSTRNYSFNEGAGGSGREVLIVEKEYSHSAGVI